MAFALAATPGPLVAAALLFGGAYPPLVAAALAVPLSASSLALMLQERAARRRGESPSRGIFYPLTWALLGIDLVAAILAVLLIGFVLHDLRQEGLR